jgi:hypothetical protein
MSVSSYSGNLAYYNKSNLHLQRLLILFNNCRV